MRFLLGSHFWYMNIESSDKDYVEYVYPSKEDLFNCKMISKQIKDKQYNDIVIKDIRMLLKEIKKGSLRAFEVLYSNPIDELNNKDKIIYGYLYLNRDLLLEELRVELMKNVIGEGRGRIKILNKNITGKELAHLQKLYWIMDFIYNKQNPFKIVLEEKYTKRLRDIRKDPKEQLFFDLKKKIYKYENIKLGESLKDKPKLNELENLIKNIIFNYLE